MKELKLIFFLLIFEFCFGEIRIGLNSGQTVKPWIVWNQNKSIQIEAKVPGGIYTDLQRAGKLDKNLFYRFNDIEYRWVSRDNWTYLTEFNVPKEIFPHKTINLVFYGIDTVADIYLNGKLLKSVSNMFVRFVIPVKNDLKEKKNILKVEFASPIYHAKLLSNIQRQSYPIPPECTPNEYNGECHVNFLRKMQASFSWDWGPAFPSVGIWKSVELEAFNIGVIRDVTIEAHAHNESSWEINSKIYIDYSESYFPVNFVSLSITKKKDDTIIPITTGKVISKRKMNTEHSYTIEMHHYAEKKLFEEWYPNGYGEQHLYNFTYIVSDENHTEVSSKEYQFGFRKVELVQEEIEQGKKGLTFYFKVNDVPIFAKGSNWIPGHILPELSYEETMIRSALEAAKEANMNMLRVWGGGLYESDVFYKIADELGILIWQDMMFACSMYPTNNYFLNSVKTEVEQQVIRLHHHPSIAVWAGNNENEAALSGSWYGTSKNFSLYKRDYVKLYVDTIRPIVEMIDTSRQYITSSPTNGKESEKEEFVAKNPYSPLFGDVHYYNYVFDSWNSKIYPNTRFASEYGFQSMPSFKSMSEVSLPSDRKLLSEFSKKRQHLPGGNDYMLGLIKHELPLPEDDGSEEFYKLLIYYSQVYQAMATKTETEKYRKDRSKLTSDNMGLTMGAMYWQLNDVWQAPSWSSIEFGGKWKMLQYYARKFFSPVLVSSEQNDNIISVFLVSDLLEDIPDVKLEILLYSWDSFKPKTVFSDTVYLHSTTSKIYTTLEISKILKNTCCSEQTCFFYLKAEGPNIFSENFVFLDKLFAMKNIRKPKLQITVTETNDPKEVDVKVTTDVIAPFVWLETNEEGEFSDNGFILIKPQISLRFKNRQNKTINVNNFKSTIQVRSLI